jgi:hypothetical protein
MTAKAAEAVQPGTALAHAGDAAHALSALDPSRFNVLTPVVSLEGAQVSPDLTASIQLVPIDFREDRGEVYHDPRYAPWNEDPKRAKFALTSAGVGKIGMAAGVKWVPNLTGMVPSSRERRPNGHVYLRYRATAAIRQPNGEWHWEPVEVDIDTEDEAEDFRATYQRQIREGRNVWKSGRSAGKPRFLEADVEDMVTREVMQLRKFLLRHAETKAKTRAIRRLLTLPQVFTYEEIVRPFAVPRLLYRPDHVNALDLERVQIEGRQAESALWGPVARSSAPALPQSAPEQESPAAATASRRSADAGGEAAAGSDQESGAVTSGEAAPGPGLEDPKHEGHAFSWLAVNDRAALKELARTSKSPKRRALAAAWLERSGAGNSDAEQAASSTPTATGEEDGLRPDASAPEQDVVDGEVVTEEAAIQPHAFDGDPEGPCQIDGCGYARENPVHAAPGQLFPGTGRQAMRGH